MTSTVNQILAKFARKFPECDASTQLSLFLDAHKRLLSRIQVRNDAQYITLTAGVREYALTGLVFKIHSAYLETDVGTSLPLIERSTDELDAMRWGWRNPNQTGSPVEYYVSSSDSGDGATNVVGFVPIPATSTSGTYPRVTLYCTTYADLVGTDTVPSNLLNDNYYLYDMYAKWSVEVAPDQSEFWETKAERELELNHEHVQNMQSQGTTGFFPLSAMMPTRLV